MLAGHRGRILSGYERGGSDPLSDQEMTCRMAGRKGKAKHLNFPRVFLGSESEDSRWEGR